MICATDIVTRLNLKRHPRSWRGRRPCCATSEVAACLVHYVAMHLLAAALIGNPRWAQATPAKIAFCEISYQMSPPQLPRSSRKPIVAPVRKHSRTPDEVYALIEATWPGPYFELFTRCRRTSWSQWPDIAEVGAR
jgi:N6-adenosine-specific RNA methylase IME4